MGTSRPLPTLKASNGHTFSRKPREPTVAIPINRCARIGGCNVVLDGTRVSARLDVPQELADRLHVRLRFILHRKVRAPLKDPNTRTRDQTPVVLRSRRCRFVVAANGEKYR